MSSIWGPQSSSSVAPDTTSTKLQTTTQQPAPSSSQPAPSAFLAAVRKGLAIGGGGCVEAGGGGGSIPPEVAGRADSDIDTIMNALDRVHLSDIQTTQNNTTPLMTRSSSLRSTTSHQHQQPVVDSRYNTSISSSWVPHTIIVGTLPYLQQPNLQPSEAQPPPHLAASMNTLGSSSWNKTSIVVAAGSPSQWYQQPLPYNNNTLISSSSVRGGPRGGGGGHVGIWLSGVDTSKYNNVGSGTKGPIPTNNAAGSCAASSAVMQGEETPVKRAHHRRGEEEEGTVDVLSTRSHTPIPHHGQSLDLSISMMSNQIPIEGGDEGGGEGLQETDLAALAEQHEATLRGIFSDMHHTSEMEMDEVKMRSIMEWEAVVCGTDAFEKFTSQLQDLTTSAQQQQGVALTPTPKQTLPLQQPATPSSHLRAGAAPFSPSSSLAAPTTPLQVRRIQSIRSNAPSTTYSHSIAATPMSTDAGRAPKRERQAVEKAERDALMVLVAITESSNNSMQNDQGDHLIKVANQVDTHIEVSKEAVQRVHNILKRSTNNNQHKQQDDDTSVTSSNTIESYDAVRAHIISSYPPSHQEEGEQHQQQISTPMPGGSNKVLMESLLEELASRDGRAVVRDWRFVAHRECGLRVLLSHLEAEGRRDILLKLVREVPGGPPRGYNHPTTTTTTASPLNTTVHDEARRRYLEATTAVQLLHYHTLTDATFMKDALSSDNIKNKGRGYNGGHTTNVVTSASSPMKATAEPYTPPTQKQLHATAAPYVPSGGTSSSPQRPIIPLPIAKPTIVLGGLLDVVGHTTLSNTVNMHPPISSSSDSATIGPQSTATTTATTSRQQQTPVAAQMAKVVSDDGSGADEEDNDTSDDEGEGSFLSTGGGNDVPLSLIQRHIALAQWWAGLEAEANVAKGALILEGEEQMARSQLAAAMQAADTHVTTQSRADNNNQLLRRCASQHVFKVVLKLAAEVGHSSSGGGGGFELLLYPPGGTLRPSPPGSKHYKPPVPVKDTIISQINALSPPHRAKLAQAATGVDPHHELSIVVYCTTTAPTTTLVSNIIPSITACTFTPVLTPQPGHSDPMCNTVSSSSTTGPETTSLDLIMSSILAHNKALFKLMK